MRNSKNKSKKLVRTGYDAGEILHFENDGEQQRSKQTESCKTK